MKPLFPTYILKKRAKKAMQGRFFKALVISALPSLVLIVCAALIFLLIPGIRQSFELALNGSFESQVARQEYFIGVLESFMNSLNIITVLFSFLNVGSMHLMIDMLRGKEVKIRNIFRFYSKWYIAIIYPAISLAITAGVSYVLNYLSGAGMDEALLSTLSWVLQIGVYFVSYKLMFVDFILADTLCSDFIGAVKKSWSMVGWNTAINSVVLAFSFFGWFILSTLTAGVGLIFVIPYMMLSQTALYDENVKFAENGV